MFFPHCLCSLCSSPKTLPQKWMNGLHVQNQRKTEGDDKVREEGWCEKRGTWCMVTEKAEVEI